MKIDSDLTGDLEPSIDAENWFTAQPPLSTSEQDQFAALMFARLIGDADHDEDASRTYAPFAPNLENLSARHDVQEVSADLQQHVRKGYASAEMLVSWRRHLLAERHRMAFPSPGTSPKLRWKKALPPRLRQIVESTDLELVPTLGRDIAAAVFVGPTRTRLVFGQDAYHDPLELEFLLYHMYLHTFGSLAVEGFDAWVEYKRDVSTEELIPLLSEEEYREQEAVISDEASCLMYDYYVTSYRLAPLSRSLVKRALKRQFGGLRLIRMILGDRSFLRRLMRLWMWTILSSLSHNPWLRHLPRPKLQFTEHIAVVREAPWKPIYLIWADPQGDCWRRWIPSRKVLHELGIRRADVAPMEDLSAYQYDGILLEPRDASKAYSALRHASRTVLPLPGGSEVRLPGLAKNVSAFSLPVGQQENRVTIETETNPLKK